MADTTGLSIAHISQIERGRSNPSIKALRALSEALDVTIGWLFFHGEAPPPQEQGVVLRECFRRRLVFQEGMIVKELISPDLAHELEMLVVTFQPGSSSGDGAYTHAGHEGGLILEGMLDIWIDEQHFRLNAGDSFGFPSTRTHRFANPGDRIAKVLWVITPPNYLPHPAG